MTDVVSQELGYGITCIDAAYVSEGTACFYLLQEGEECAVIETGTSHSVPLLQQLLAQRGIDAAQVRYVIPTHVHLDHAGGAGAMMAAFPRAELLIHPRGARHMSDPARLIEGATAVYGEALFQELYGEILAVDSSRIQPMLDQQTVSLAGRELEFRHTRGHAEHHFCVWDEKSRAWFSGDMFGVCYPWFRFAGGDFILPSTTPSQFDPETYLASLALLDSYQPQRMYLTHFGAVDYSSERSRLLAHQIDAYSQFAEQFAHDSASLEQHLGAHAMQLMHQLGATKTDAELEKILTFDLQLNTQGLQIWQQRINQ